MFDYQNVGCIDKLPEDIREKVRLKKEEDLNNIGTAEYQLQEGLLALKKYFRDNSSNPIDLPFAILKFINTRGAETIVESEEFKEMTVITVVTLLSQTIKDSELLENINLVMIRVLGTSIGKSDYYKKMFLNQNGKEIISIRDMRKVMDILEEMSVKREEYLLELEIKVRDREEQKGLSWLTLDTLSFIKNERDKIGLNTQINVAEYLDIVDKCLNDGKVFDAVQICRLLKKDGFPIEGKRDNILTGYENATIGEKDVKALAIARKEGLAPSVNLLNRLKGLWS